MTTTPGKLPTSRAFLDRLARKLGDPKDPRKPASDYRVAKALGLTSGAISKLRAHKGTFGNENAVKLAELLGEPAGYVVACVNYERERSVRVRVVWEAIARAAAIGAVVIVSSAAQALGLDRPAPASQVNDVAGYTLCDRLRRRARHRRAKARVLRARRRHRRSPRRRQLVLPFSARRRPSHHARPSGARSLR